jgi:glycogen synthase kinase 3 beta
MLDLNYNNLSNKAQSSLTTTNHQSTKVSNQKAEMTYSDYILIGNGTFGLVYKAKCDQTNEIVAIKTVFQDIHYKNRELSILKELNNINCIKIKDYFFTTKHSSTSEKEKYLNVVMDYFPITLTNLIQNNNFSQNNTKHFLSTLEIKLYSYQMFHALFYLETINVCHRDIKPQNILIDPDKKLLKICDFGSAKKLEKGVSNVAYICSRYYRAPELIFNAEEYTNAIDMWSVCCVICEMVLEHPLFQGESSVDQIVEIIKVCGTPSKNDIKSMNKNYKIYKFPLIKCFTLHEIFKDYIKYLGEEFINLIKKILVYNPNKRLKPIEALIDPFFDDIREKGVLENDLENIIFCFTNEEKKYMGNDIYQKLIPKWYKIKLNSENNNQSDL